MDDKGKKRNLGVRMPVQTSFKLHRVAKSEQRSVSGQILYLVRKCVEEFEAKDGEIPVPSEK